MARDRANVNTGIWNDADYRHLTPAAQWLYFLLMTHPTLTYVGVADWRPKRITPFAAGLTAGFIEQAAAELVAGLYVVIDEDTEEVLVRSFVKHDGILKQPRLAVSMANAYAQTASNEIRGVVVHELRKQREAHPEYACWEDKRIADILVQPSISPTVSPPLGDGLAPQFGDGFGDGFGPNLTPRFGPTEGMPTATATTTPSSTKKECSPPPSTKSATKSFDEWWKHWRKKKSVGDARKAFPKALAKIPLEELIERTDAYWAWVDQTSEDEKFIPYPATWLNREQWADDLTDSQQPQAFDPRKDW